MVQASPDLLFVGVDGGGSRCRVRVRSAGGTVLAEREGGTANVYLDEQTALSNIRSTIADALAAVPRPGAEPGTEARLRLGLGLAGVSSAHVGAKVAHDLGDLGTVAVVRDTEIACLGAHGGQDGGLIVAGTGSGAIARVGGRSVAIGGRGFLLGDDGSGARLGLAAWRRALRAHDGLEPETPLTRTLMAQFDHDPVATIQWGRTARSSDFAMTVPLVFSCAQDGDPTALDLLAATAAALAELGAALRRVGAERLCITGGLAEPIRPYLPAPLREQLQPALFDPLDGALLLAGAPFRTDTGHAGGEAP